MNQTTPTVIDKSVELLAPFGLVPGDHTIFSSPLVLAAHEIRTLYPVLSYDHRPEAPDWDNKFPYLATEQFRRGYACFKYAVSKVIQPRSICEIGIGAGTGARAFLAASPKAHYTGIDNGSKDAEDGCKLIEYTHQTLCARDYRHELIIQDSMSLPSAPCVDLFHVDGAHDFAHAMNDCKLAFLSGSRWILVDDARDPAVCAAAMMAAYGAKKMFEWTYFEDTWTGSILYRMN